MARKLVLTEEDKRELKEFEKDHFVSLKEHLGFDTETARRWTRIAVNARKANRREGLITTRIF